VLAEAGPVDPDPDQLAAAAVLGYRAAGPKRRQSRRPLGEVVRYA
jgi:hypothetical protein